MTASAPLFHTIRYFAGQAQRKNLSRYHGSKVTMIYIYFTTMISRIEVPPSDALEDISRRVEKTAIIFRHIVLHYLILFLPACLRLKYRASRYELLAFRHIPSALFHILLFSRRYCFIGRLLISTGFHFRGCKAV